MIYSFSP